MSFTRNELYEIHDALHEVVTRMCARGQTEIEIKEHSLQHLWSASKKVTVMLLGTDNTPGIKDHEPIVLQAISSPKLQPESSVNPHPLARLRDLADEYDRLIRHMNAGGDFHEFQVAEAARRNAGA